MNAIAIGKWRFEPRPWPSLAAAVLVMLTLSLGQWQARRAQQKVESQVRIDALAAGPSAVLPAKVIEASDFVQRPIEVHGQFLPEQTLFIDNRVYHMRPGYHVITPLRINGGNVHVVVNRGWVAADPRREVLPQVDTPVGEIVLHGVAVIPPNNVYELAPDTASGSVKQHVALDQLGARWKIALQPVVIEQTSSAVDGLVRDWPRQDAGADTHLAYAFQWNVMAAVIALLWISLNLSKDNVPG